MVGEATLVGDGDEGTGGGVGDGDLHAGLAALDFSCVKCAEAGAGVGEEVVARGGVEILPAPMDGAFVGEMMAAEGGLAVEVVHGAAVDHLALGAPAVEEVQDALVDEGLSLGDVA